MYLGQNRILRWFDRIRGRIDDAYQFLANCLWHRWNVVRIRTLNAQWHDRDEVLMHCMFQVLVDFFEGESPAEQTQWDNTDIKDDAWQEIQALYRWWKKERPARRDPIVDADDAGWTDPDNKRAEWYDAFRKSRELNKLWLLEDEEMMIRLVRVRGHLWT